MDRQYKREGSLWVPDREIVPVRRVFPVRRLPHRNDLSPKAAIAFGQCQQTVNAGSSATNQVTISTSPGSLLISFVRASGTGNSWTVTDSSGSNTWTQTSTGFATGPGGTAPTSGVFYSSGSAAVTSVTANFSPTPSSSAHFVLEFTGILASGARDFNQDNGQTAVTSYVSAALTSVFANELLFFGVGTNSTISGFTGDVGAGWAVPANGSSTVGGVEYKIVSAIQTGITTTVTWTTARDGAAIIASFIAAATDDVISTQNQWNVTIG